MENMYKNGKKDDYTGKSYVKTIAQAEGVIDGIFTDYIMKNVSNHRFKYSMFESVVNDEYSKNDKLSASSEEIIFKDFE